MIYFGNLYCIPVYEGQLDPHSIFYEFGFSSFVKLDSELPSIYNEWVCFPCLGLLFIFLTGFCRVFPTAADLTHGFSIPHPSYGPFNLTLFPPSFPISCNDPIITIYPFICTLYLDHYKIPHAEGTIGVGVLAKAKTWAGPLHMLWFMAQNRWDMVAKSDGWHGAGEQIVCFVIVAHKLVTHL
jgi:hypothetical protein